jgi:hypothetical protein
LPWPQLRGRAVDRIQCRASDFSGEGLQCGCDFNGGCVWVVAIAVTQKRCLPSHNPA